MRFRGSLMMVVLLVAGIGQCQSERWAEFGEYAKRLAPLDPTPAGEGHLGLIESGKWVPMRFPVPEQEAAGYWLRIGAVVGYSGKGTSYQLLLRRDSADGELIHEGPVVTNGDEWNQSNLAPIDLTEKITAADRQRGYIDVFVGATVAGDGWTSYRYGTGRDLFALATVMDEESTRQMKAAAALTNAGVSLIPVPREVQLTGGEFALEADTVICHSEGDDDAAFAARELQALIQERTGFELGVRALDPQAENAPANALVLMKADLDVPSDSPEAYALEVSADGARVRARHARGILYGAMTLGQMARKTDAGPGIACCNVKDWPAFPYRIIQYDIARGQSVDVEYVKRMIRALARCKINGLLFYMEDDFRFRAFPFLGREGTFTHEKARELTEYARPYHMQLIPQFEALGHASAVLRHPEMEKMREAGDPWVFCTSEPETWKFLDTVFAELVEAFPTTEFIHTGADEFEFGFAKCPQCKAKVDASGMGALYAEHMNKLNQLVKKHGRTMMFWPSHHGPTPELSDMTLKYSDQMEKDCIPTEWIYHGPAEYPTLKQYQQAGFKDVHCCPAVVSYSVIWPDYETTMRGIRGFYRAGAEEGCGGAYCTTWEFMHGALIENSMYGLLFAADCSWNPRSTSIGEFDRRFADQWLGTSAQEAPGLVAQGLRQPVARTGAAGMWRNWRLTTDMLWTAPRDVMREFGLKTPVAAANAGALIEAMQAARSKVRQLGELAGENKLTLRAADLGFALAEYAGRKVNAFREITPQYAALRKPLGEGELEARQTALAEVVARLRALGDEARTLATEYRYFIDNCGAYVGDATRLETQADQLSALARELEALKDGLATPAALPPGTKFGLLSGTYAKAGGWEPAQMSEEGVNLTLDVTAHIKQAGAWQVEWQYDRGAHGLVIHKVSLLENGQVISEDSHRGWAGSGSNGNVYDIRLPEYHADAKYELVAEIASSGGTDSSGTIWLIRPEE